MRASKTTVDSTTKSMLLLSEKIEQLSELVNKMEILAQKLELCSMMWLTIDQLVEYLPTHPSKMTVYKWISNGKIPYYQKSKDCFFLRSEIDAWLDKGYVPVRKTPEERAEEYLKNHPTKWR